MAVSKGVYSLVYTVAIAVAISIILALCWEYLPDSPFQTFIKGTEMGTFNEYVKYIGYFIPINRMIVVMEAWVLCMTNWYTFKIILRLFNGVSASLSSSGL